MMTDNQRVYLDALSKRWQKSVDQVVEMAIDGAFDLWFTFSNVTMQRVKKKKKNMESESYEQIEVRPQTEVLAMIVGRCDRMQVAAEYPCLNEKGKPVLISNSVGDEWGETSMIGLNPMHLFARIDDLLQVEHDNGIRPFIIEAPPSCGCHEAVQETIPTVKAEKEDELIPSNHPCFAPELHIALTCWLELMADATQPDAVQKTDILAWLCAHYPDLSKTAGERIAKVVSPISIKRQ